MCEVTRKLSGSDWHRKDQGLVGVLEFGGEAVEVIVGGVISGKRSLVGWINGQGLWWRYNGVGDKFRYGND